MPGFYSAEKGGGYPRDGVIRVRREVKRRKGITVTMVLGVPLENGDLQEFEKDLKRRCGAGGSVKDDVIVIQGYHRQALLDELGMPESGLKRK